MTRTFPPTIAAVAALLVVTMTWLPTLSTPHAAPNLAATVRIAALA